MQFEHIPADVIEKQRKLEMIQRKMEREIRMEKEKTALYMIVYKQSGNESVHKQEIAFRKRATAMRKELESFCRANGLVYYPDRIKIMEGEDIYVRTKGKYDSIAKGAKAGNLPLTKTENDDTINNDYAMYRKKGNEGVFCKFPEHMSKKHIRNIAKEVGIELKGITINIDRNEDLIRILYTGRADSDKIGGITFFPNAFINKETLIRTIYHEKIHVEQFKKYGTNYVQNNRYEFEVEAYAKEEEFIKSLKERELL